MNQLRLGQFVVAVALTALGALGAIVSGILGYDLGFIVSAAIGAVFGLIAAGCPGRLEIVSALLSLKFDGRVQADADFTEVASGETTPEELSGPTTGAA